MAKKRAAKKVVRKQLRKLSHTEFFQLTKLMERDAVNVPIHSTSFLVEKYSKEMNTPVSESSVITAAKALDLQTLTMLQRGGHMKDTSRLERIEARLETLERRVQDLEDYDLDV